MGGISDGGDRLPSEKLEHACTVGLLGRNREVAEDVVLTRARVVPVGARAVPQLHLSMRSTASGKSREVRIGNLAWIAPVDGPRLPPVDYLLGATPLLLSITRDDFVPVGRLRPVRIPATDISWGADGHLEGWMFGIRPCLAGALDAEPLPDGTWETFNVPCHSFEPGDLLLAPPGIHHLPWGEALQAMRGFAHVVEAEADERDDETGASVPGSVTFLTGPRPDRPEAGMTFKVSQAEFRRFLKEGRLPAGATPLSVGATA